MPNHVTNILEVKGDPVEIATLWPEIGRLPYDEEDPVYIDFTLIEPMPEDLRIDAYSSAESIARARTGYQDGIIPRNVVPVDESEYDEKTLALADRMTENIRKHGHPHWYHWSLEHWGTKWNAYYQHYLSASSISFDTAWSTPVEVIRKLSLKYPTLSFRVLFADEDFGQNCGIYEYRNGEIVEMSNLSGTDAGLALAEEIQGYNPYEEEEHA